jgi:hypothetical protein
MQLAVADEFMSCLKRGLNTASAGDGWSPIIELQAVSFLASVNDVLRCHDEGAANGIAVGPVSKNYSVIRVIQATQLDEILAVYPTIDHALAVFWTDKCSLG